MNLKLSRNSKSNTSDFFDRIIEYGIIFLIVFTPFAFGSVHTWAYTTMEITICILMIVWMLKLIIINIKGILIIPVIRPSISDQYDSRLQSGLESKSRDLKFSTPYSTTPINYFGFARTPMNVPIILFVGLILFQMIPLPPKVLKSISPGTHDLYKMILPGWPEKGPFSAPLISDLDNEESHNLTTNSESLPDPSERHSLAGKIHNLKSAIQTWQPISIYPYATKTELLKVLAYIGIFFLIINTPGLRINRIIVIIICVGFFISFLGILQELSGTTKIYWIRDASYASPFGPYINRNHFAGYIGMVIPLCLGFLLSRITSSTSSRSKSWRHLLSKFESHLMGNVTIVFAITIMITALFLSLSRGGILSFSITLVIFIGFVVLHRTKASFHRGKRLMLSTLIITLGFIVWLGLGPVINRLSDLSSPTRYEVAQNTINMAIDYPLFGTGLGTFQYIYPMYKTVQGQLYYDHAHNDYVEHLSDSGIIGFLIALGGLTVFFWKVSSIWWERKDPFVKGVVLGGLCGTISILLHSFTDFNLHIPANAIFLSIILGLTYNAVNLRKVRIEKKNVL